MKPARDLPINDLDVDHFLDRQRIGWHHVRVIALLILVMLIDSYDIFIVGAILPFLASDMGVKPQAFTSIFILQQLALLIGTFFIGPISDRFGRRRTLLVCTTCFTLLSFATTQATTPAMLIAIRCIASLFFASVIPNAIALSSEIAPQRLRAGIVSLVFCGFTGGHFIEAFVQAYTLEHFGWQSAFWVGGGLGLMILALLYFYLPESIRFRARRDPADPRIGSALLAMDPGLNINAQTRFILQDPVTDTGRTSVSALFTKSRIAPTLLLWLAFLTSFIVNHLVGSWNTTVLHDMAGLSMQHLAAGLSCSTIAGIMGTATSGFVMDRFGARNVVPIFFLGGALAIGSLGYIDLGGADFLLASALSGYFINSGLAAINALGALIYPSSMRATGVAWAAGAGRAGGMLGPAIGGVMLGLHSSVATIYLVTAMPLVIAALAIMFIRRSTY